VTIERPFFACGSVEPPIQDDFVLWNFLFDVHSFFGVKTPKNE
jgi:hypothetical protein